MKFLEEAFVLAGVKEMELAYEDVLFRTISSLHEALEEVVTTVGQVTKQMCMLEMTPFSTMSRMRILTR